MLQTSKVKQKLKNGEIVIRAFLRSSDPTSAEIMALAGVDLIVIDNEHYPFNPQRMETIIRAAETYGAECMGRVPNTEPARIAQIMDMGAIGVVVPHIESREEALAVVDAVKYAPVGHRGFCPITRAASYGMAMSGDEYTRLANEQTCIILMTETKKGLEALDDILAIPEVDGISIECPTPNKIVISGIDKEKVGQFAANVRSKRPPEPYKGKGIKYADEVIIRKEGKTGK